MRQIPTWDQYYLDICKVVATRSKDPNTQIGCVIIGPNHEIRSTGYNSFPRGIRDDVPERLVRPMKYLWIEHAERNAICNAARAGNFVARQPIWRKGSIACFTSMARVIGVAASLMDCSTKFGTAMTFSRSSTIWRTISRRRRKEK